MSKSLDTLSEVGDKVTEAAVRSGYGPTIRADAVKKLVDSVVNFQERSAEIIIEMRKLSTQNSAEIRDAVEDGKEAHGPADCVRRYAPRCRVTAAVEKPSMAETALAPSQPQALDDVMIAMDVVDTLRHRDDLVRRELNEEGRESELIARLRQIYRDQGIEVPDRVLADGVKALKDSRFVYTPPAGELETHVAHAMGEAGDAWQAPGRGPGSPDRDPRRLLRSRLAAGEAGRRASTHRDHRDACRRHAAGACRRDGGRRR